MENKNMTIVTGSLEELEGNLDLMKVIFNNTLDKVPEGYSLKSINYEKDNKESDYGLKVVVTENK